MMMPRIIHWPVVELAVTAPGREERQKLEHGIILPAVFNKTLFWSSHAFKITHEIAPGLPQLDRNL